MTKELNNKNYNFWSLGYLYYYNQEEKESDLTDLLSDNLIE
jgi:hypothetical protein